MPKDKRSFFERLTGSVKIDQDEELEMDEAPRHIPVADRDRHPHASSAHSNGRGQIHHPKLEPQAPDDWMEESAEEGQLTVDVYQTASDIFIKTIVAGVRPDDLDISITRDMVTIKGRREEIHEASDEDYFHRELYWGAFTRTILLPEEIDVEAAEATERHGLLTLKLPKIDKRRSTKLRVKAS